MTLGIGVIQFFFVVYFAGNTLVVFYYNLDQLDERTGFVCGGDQIVQDRESRTDFGRETYQFWFVQLPIGIFRFLTVDFRQNQRFQDIFVVCRVGRGIAGFELMSFFEFCLLLGGLLSALVNLSSGDSINQFRVDLWLVLEPLKAVIAFGPEVRARVQILGIFPSPISVISIPFGIHDMFYLDHF